MDVKTKLLIYSIAIAVYLLMSLIAFILMYTDKRRAKKQRSRIPERILFLFSLLFGASGGTLAMYAFRHKTQHWYFRLFFPLLALLQIALLILGTAKLLTL